ncbi:hypothetical protein HY045_03585 [Candidatus Woesebacteria bacterium]|nr:hypothetical protein [Candidatus Woesebacteria bacterium]
MNNKLFWAVSFLILLLGLFLRLFATKDHHYYFTVDEGNDAVNIREIIERKQVQFNGPVTEIEGVYTGPLWYYFVGIGYLITKGDPFGAPLMVILLNLFLTFVLMVVIKRYVGQVMSLVVGASMQFFWDFFKTSLYGFNPFPLVALAFFLIFFLIQFLRGKKKYYLFGSFIIILGFNTEIAGTVAFFLFFALIGLWGIHKKIFNLKYYLLCNLLIIFLALTPILHQFGKQFFLHSSLPKPSVGSGNKVFMGSNFDAIISNFIDLTLSTAFPLNKFFATFFVGIIFLTYITIGYKNSFVSKFIKLTTILFFVSLAFFASNKGWRDWHTVYLAPLIFVSFILIISSLPKALKLSFLTVLIVSNIVYFSASYNYYLNLQNDNGLLSNKLRSLDWIYTHNEGNGFNAYTYTNTFFDYTYQYLFWWYGKGKYGFVPCEYANYPLSHKELYIPGYLYYSKPTLGCDKIRFVIIKSDTNGEKNKDWIITFRKYNTLIDRTEFNGIKIEKYYVKEGSPTDLCIWRNVC